MRRTHFLAELFGCVEVDRKGAKVPIVDPDDSCIRLKSSLHFLQIVDFDENIELITARNGKKMMQFLLFQRPDDEQNGICTRHYRFKDLNFVNEEIFPQEREIHDLPNLGEVREMPLEIFFVREDGKCVSSRFGIGFGDLDGIKIGRNDPRRG